MMKNDTLNMLIGLNKRGVQLHITEDGWRKFLEMMQEEESATREDSIVAAE